MYRLIYIAVLSLTCLSTPRSPRIYNVLISSKKNLSPSHSQPVYEPVLRTTSLGYAFPPLLYHTSYESYVQPVPTYINSDYSGLRKINTPYNEAAGTFQNQPAQQYFAQEIQPNQQPLQPQQILPDQIKSDDPHQIVEAAPVEHFVPSSYSQNGFKYAQYLPKNQEGQAAPSPILSQSKELIADPKRVIANLKKNSDIPDVPPPPLPVKTS